MVSKLKRKQKNNIELKQFQIQTYKTVNLGMKSFFFSI